jgi:hypothetical protein
MFDEHIDRRDTGVRVSAQLGADAGRSTGDAVRAVLAWQHAMTVCSLRATPSRRSRTGGWRLVARGHVPGACVGGIWVDVWTIMQPAAPTDARMVDVGSDVAAAALLARSAALGWSSDTGACRSADATDSAEQVDLPRLADVDRVRPPL